jgi:DNA invertase Pin-like site-specific DNA recombinase
MIIEQRPYEITPAHLVKLAIIYVRQSSEFQVLNNKGSPAYQRSQVRFPQAWGWAESRIKIVEDPAESGTTGDRPGYQEIIELIKAGAVGALFIWNFQRGGRENVEWLILLNLCAIHNVLVVEDGRVHDMRHSGNRLYARIMAAMAEYENDTRREVMSRAKRQKASESVVTVVPIGFVVVGDGILKLDPDPDVQETVRAIFRGYRTARSIVGAVRWLREQKHLRLVTRSRRTGEIRPWKPNRSTVSHALHNPIYRGQYQYGQTRLEPTLKTPEHKKIPRRPTPISERVIHQKRYEAYLSDADSDEIQRLLEVNRTNKSHTNLGPSPFPLQGVGRCALHPYHVLRVHPGNRLKKTGAPMHMYFCLEETETGSRNCISVHGPFLDRAIRDAVLRRLSPPAMELLREELKRVRHDAFAENHRRRSQLNRMRQAVEDLRYSHDNAIRARNFRVAADIEKRLEEALAKLDELERVGDAATSEISTLDDGVLDELIAMSSNLLALYDSPATTPRERKQIIRMMVQSVIIERCDGEVARARIVWSDGVPDTVLEVPLLYYPHRVIREKTAEAMNPKHIAEVLNAMEFTTSKGTSWSGQAITQQLRAMRRDGRDRGLTSVDQDVPFRQGPPEQPIIRAPRVDKSCSTSTTAFSTSALGIRAHSQEPGSK